MTILLRTSIRKTKCTTKWDGTLTTIVSNGSRNHIRMPVSEAKNIDCFSHLQ